jgi:riboflavin biosynthesis pyrimidine reductase
VTSLRRLLPDAGVVDTADEAARGVLRDWYAWLPGERVRIGLVTTVDGDAAGDDGTSGDLSGGADRAVLGVLREVADVVLIGASTLRAEPHLVPRRTRLAVLTGSGDLGPAPLRRPDGAPVPLVLAPADAAAGIRAAHGDAVEVVALDDRAEDRGTDDDGLVRAAVAELDRRGHARIMCEGGPDLARRLIRAGLADELCLTTAPRLGSGRLPALTTPADLALRALAVDDGGRLFARWAVRPRS